LIDYLHDLPGRLRVRSPLFRKNAERATAVRNSLESVDGVRSATVNLVTGSVTIYYDCSRASTATLLETLRYHGCSGHRHALPPHAPAIGKTVAGFLVEKAIERSLMAVVAAVF
jgi:copper chaperone CopZ